MGKKEQPRKSAWRGISVKMETRPTSFQSVDSGRTSISWEQPKTMEQIMEEEPAPMASYSASSPPPMQPHQHHSTMYGVSDDAAALYATPYSSTTSGPAPSLADSMSSSTDSKERQQKSSKDKRTERLGNLGSLTKTYEGTEKERQRREQRQREKEERKAIKELQKAEKKALEDQKREQRIRKELEKKAAKDQERQRKEEEKKNKRSKAKSLFFTKRSSSSSVNLNADSVIELPEERTSTEQRRSLLSFNRHSMASTSPLPSPVTSSSNRSSTPRAYGRQQEEVHEKEEEEDEELAAKPKGLSALVPSRPKTRPPPLHTHMPQLADFAHFNLPGEDNDDRDDFDQQQRQQHYYDQHQHATPPPVSPFRPDHEQDEQDPDSPTDTSFISTLPKQQETRPALTIDLAPIANRPMPPPPTHVASSSLTSPTSTTATSTTAKTATATTPTAKSGHNMSFILNSLQMDDDSDSDSEELEMGGRQATRGTRTPSQDAQKKSLDEVRDDDNDDDEWMPRSRPSYQEHQLLDQQLQALELIAQGVTASSPPPTGPLPPLPPEVPSLPPLPMIQPLSINNRMSIASSKLSRASSTFSTSSYDTVAEQQPGSASTTTIPAVPTIITKQPIDQENQESQSDTEHAAAANAIAASMMQAMTVEQDTSFITTEKPNVTPSPSSSSSIFVSDDGLSSDSFESTEIPDPFVEDDQTTAVTTTTATTTTTPAGTNSSSIEQKQPLMVNTPPNLDKKPSPPPSPAPQVQKHPQRKSSLPALASTVADMAAAAESEPVPPMPADAPVSVMQQVTMALNVKSIGDNATAYNVKQGQLDIQKPKGPTVVAPMAATIEITDNSRSASPASQQNTNTKTTPASAATATVTAAVVAAANAANAANAASTASTSTSTTPTPMTAPSTPTPDTNKLPNDNANNANGIRANHLGPREQEDLDQPIRQGTRFLFSNKFAKAKSLFQQKADTEPLYAFGLASMQFLKAMMTSNEQDVDLAMELLTQAYTVADTQAELSEDKFDDTFSQQIQSLVVGSSKAFKSNGVMRAHTIKAESCLLMGLLQLCQENVAGYLKAGLNLRKACSSYTLVWEEYQRMCQSSDDEDDDDDDEDDESDENDEKDDTNSGDPLAWLDKNTVSGIQFGVGSMHLLLTLLPDKILHQFAGLPWKVDKDLGMDLLKQSMAGQGTRAAFSALMLLSYFSILSSLVPSIYGQESIQPTIDCLVAAQQSYPKSCFFLYYAARISRVARNVSLSTQSFGMASASVRKAAWAEVAMKHTVAYEVGLNHALQLDWDTSAAYFEQLGRARDWSPAFCQYFVGACHEMSGQRQEAIEVFDDVPVLVHHQHHRRSCLDNFVLLRVEQHQQADYQDLDHRLPGLELLLVLNAFSFMEEIYLDRCVTMIHETSQLINTAVLLLLDNTSAHHHELLEPEAQSVVTRYATLRLLNAAVHNALGKYTQAQLDIQWLTAHQAYLRQEDWLIPFIYWEAGVAHWGLDDHRKSREWWQQALSCVNYDFEYRMASRVHLAFDKCDALGIHLDAPRHARKRTQA